MNSFIENASRFDVATGHHADAGVNSVLIQISDINAEHPTPKMTFKEVYQFRFEDIEEDTEFAITGEQAKMIASLLRKAQESTMNVIVHCHAGLCRSGAVAERGVMLGFSPPDRVRLPNALVKKKIMKELGFEITEFTSVFAEEFYDRRFD